MIEVSMQEGLDGTWIALWAGVQALRRDARVYFQVDDLTSVVDSEAGLSFPEAYIRGRLRVRVTAGIQSDRAVGDPELMITPKLFESSWSLSNRQRHRLIVKRSDLLLKLRDDYGDFSGGNSQFKAFDWPEVGQNDNERGERLCMETIKRYDRVVWRGPVELPRLRFAYSDGTTVDNFRPGDLVIGIEAENNPPPRDPPAAGWQSAGSPTTLADYALLRRIGAGAYGDVPGFIVHDTLVSGFVWSANAGWIALDAQ